MKRLDRRKCDVCGRRRLVRVYSSLVGPFSIGLCGQCARLYAEPYWEVEALVRKVGGLRNCHESFKSVLAFKDGLYQEVGGLFFNIDPHPSWDIIDSSKIKDYMACPRYYLLRHIFGWERLEPNIHLIFGEAWHRLQECLLILGYTKEAIEEGMKRFKDYYRRYFSSQTDDIHFPKIPGTALAGAKLYVDQYKATDPHRFKVIHTEVSGAVPLIGDNKLYLRTDSVLLDQELEKYTSFEHKTGSRLDQKWLDKWILDFSVGTYTHLLYCLHPPEKVWGVRINGSIFKKSGINHVRVPVRKTKPMMEDWLITATYWVDQIKRDMANLSICSDSNPTLNAFHKKSENCMTYFGCKYHGFCVSKANPLRHYDHPPQGMQVRFWDPREREAKSELKFKEGKPIIEEREVKPIDRTDQEDRGNPEVLSGGLPDEDLQRLSSGGDGDGQDVAS